MKKIVEINNLDFHYSNKKQLLSGFNLLLGSGRIYTLFGEKDEGKSTLLNLITGLSFPINGNIKVLGFEPCKRNYKMLQDIFYLTEEIQNSTLSIQSFERVYVPFYPNFSSSTFYKYMNDFSLDLKNERIDSLSPEKRKMFIIAFGLSTNSRVILLDEPTKGLDTSAINTFRNLLSKSINDRNCILIASDLATDLYDLPDEIMVMENHQIVLHETKENISEKFCFKVCENAELEDSILYSEEMPEGFNQLFINKTGENSKADIGLFYNAYLSNKEMITNVLNEQKQ